MSLTYRISDLANTTPVQWAGHGTRSGKQGARRDEDRMQASALVDWREQARGRSSRIADDGSVIYVADPTITPEDQAWAARHVAMLTRATRGAGRMQ